MAEPIEHYALIGNTQTAALVSRRGAIDWLCLPRFDSAACLAALLGTERHGHFTLRAAAPEATVTRCYHAETLVLETTFHTPEAIVVLTDFMPPAEEGGRVDLVRLVRGMTGEMPMELELVMRFGYGRIVPWVRRRADGLHAVAGPDALRFATPVVLDNRDLQTRARFAVQAGQTIPFVLTWFPSHKEPPPLLDPLAARDQTIAAWHSWSAQSSATEPYREATQRSLITLKALTYSPTGGIVAAPTTSLPEELGGVRNWDYRFCWLRDASFTLYALLISGYRREAEQWTAWLRRACAGMPSQTQILYGLGGERFLPEYELPWLPGYESSRPVRVGNAAFEQFQLDVFGQVIDCFHNARLHGLELDGENWFLGKALLEHLENVWNRPDEGIWEVRGARQHFTYSKVMAWVAFDRAIKSAKRFGLDGPLDHWQALRAHIREEILQKGFNPRCGTFVQYFGGDALDAALLLLPLVRFLPAKDPRMRATIEAIERELVTDGLVRRYATEERIDGLPGGEGAFLACSFWLVDNLAMLGRQQEAQRWFQRLLALRNDVGLLSEEYDPVSKRALGNFPQALSHLALINSAANLRLHGQFSGLQPTLDDSDHLT